MNSTSIQGCDLPWRKSSYSGENQGNCVEVAAPDGGLGVVCVRDSKNKEMPFVSLSPGAFSAFTKAAASS